MVEADGTADQRIGILNLVTLSPSSVEGGANQTGVSSHMILAVVVLYNTDRDRSQTLRGLEQAVAQNPALLNDIRVLLWDNSPEPLLALKLPFAFEYRHSGGNAGVAGAYNQAAAFARLQEIPWLLLLDQDTAVTEEFLRVMAGHAHTLAANQTVAAAVPFLYAGNFQLSPRFVRFSRHTAIPASSAGLLRERMFAANSGTLMRRTVLEEIGGYSDDFWLDYSDIYVFHRLYEQGKGVFVAADAYLQHEIAMLDYDGRMTAQRYRNYLAAEGAFHDLYKSRLERFAHLLRLLARAVRQRRYRDPVFRQITWQSFWERLWTRRKCRLAQWKQAGEARRGESSKPQPGCLTPQKPSL